MTSNLFPPSPQPNIKSPHMPPKPSTRSKRSSITRQLVAPGKSKPRKKEMTPVPAYKAHVNLATWANRSKYGVLRMFSGGMAKDENIEDKSLESQNIGHSTQK